jgi:hypothetical protein
LLGGQQGRAGPGERVEHHTARRTEGRIRVRRAAVRIS